MRWPNSDRGQSLLEFAFVAPLVLVFLLAIVDFGIAVDRRLVLDHAVREGARFASVGGQALTTGSPALLADVQGYTSDQSQGISMNVTVCYENTNGGPLGDVGDNVRVSIQYTHDFVTGFTAIFDTDVASIVMNPSASARIERAQPVTGAIACLS